MAFDLGFNGRMYGMEIVVVPFPMLTVPVRRHPRKKRRLQKKWLTRYGTKQIPSPTESPFNFYVDERRGRAYCYAQGKAALMAEIAK